MNFKKYQVLFLIGMYLATFVPCVVALPDEPFYPTPKFSTDDSVPVVSCTDVVTNVDELKAKLTLTMPKGYTLCLAPGTYRDIKITYGGSGTPEQPITLAAQEPGTALITGNVNVRMAGSHVILQGLVFRGGSSIGDLIGTERALMVQVLLLYKILGCFLLVKWMLKKESKKMLFKERQNNTR